MLFRLRKILSDNFVRRVLHGVSANILNQATVLLIQIILVPVMASYWGVARYGFWLLIFSVPAYLGLGDFGFGTAAGVRMTMEVARGDKKAAIATFQNASMVIWIVTFTLAVIGGFGLWQLPIEEWNTAGWTSIDVRWGLLLLFLYGVVCLHSSLPFSGYRCVGLYSLGTLLQTLTMLSETIVAVGLVWAGMGLVWVAAGYLATRIVSLIIQTYVLHARVPWLKSDQWLIRKSIVTELARPALAVMALPIAQAAFLQGTALVVGVVVGPAAVAGYTTVRTLIRTGIQMTTLLNHAIMPEMSAAAARNDNRTIRHLVLATIGGSLAVVLPGAVILSFIGSWVISVWTRGAITADPTLLAVMTAVMVVNGVWHPLSNLLLSINRQASFSYFYAVAAIASVAASWPLCSSLGSAGAAWAILALDLIMFTHVGQLIWHIMWKPSTPDNQMIASQN